MGFAVVEFRLLVPLELVGDDGRVIELPAGQPRPLLALLLLDAGRIVSGMRSLVLCRPEALVGFRSRTIEATATVAIRTSLWRPWPTRLGFAEMFMEARVGM